MKHLYLLLRIVVAVIFVQTLYFKFTASPESVYIFETVGQEPVGRIGSGVVELIAAVLILIPSTIAIGALLGVGVMSGAIFFHLTKLGIEIQGDGGLLFALAVVAWICAFVTLLAHRRSLPVVGARLP
ncbi:MAG: DoxX family protein [Opitutaceae bacterium]|nr:DoxX family protein [Opitutaceae bacterium]